MSHIGTYNASVMETVRNSLDVNIHDTRLDSQIMSMSQDEVYLRACSSFWLDVSTVDSIVGWIRVIYDIDGERTPQRLDFILQSLREGRGLDFYDTRIDAELLSMPKDKMFYKMLEKYNLSYIDHMLLLNWFQDIYEIKLV